MRRAVAALAVVGGSTPWREHGQPNHNLWERVLRSFYHPQREPGHGYVRARRGGIDEVQAAELLAVISLLVRGGRILLAKFDRDALFCSRHLVNRIGRLDAAASV
jgi:hypothetical protein